jgi:hypothetical protein
MKRAILFCKEVLHMPNKSAFPSVDIQYKKDVDVQALQGHIMREYSLPDCKVSICDDAYKNKTEQAVRDSRVYAQQVVHGLLLHAQKEKHEGRTEITP